MYTLSYVMSLLTTPIQLRTGSWTGAGNGFSGRGSGEGVVTEGRAVRHEVHVFVHHVSSHWVLVSTVPSSHTVWSAKVKVHPEWWMEFWWTLDQR